MDIRSQSSDRFRRLLVKTSAALLILLSIAFAGCKKETKVSAASATGAGRRR